jgi:hypothetical protein
MKATYMGFVSGRRLVRKRFNCERSRAKKRIYAPCCALRPRTYIEYSPRSARPTSASYLHLSTPSRRPPTPYSRYVPGIGASARSIQLACASLIRPGAVYKTQPMERECAFTCYVDCQPLRRIFFVLFIFFRLPIVFIN